MTLYNLFIQMLIIISLWFLSLLGTSFERERKRALVLAQLTDQLSSSQLSYELERSWKQGPVAQIWPHKDIPFNSGHESWEGNIKYFCDVRTQLVQYESEHDVVA